jgi:hypothetical protein
MSIAKSFGWIILGVVVALITINASVMLISPRAWFRLPNWLRAQGTLTEEKYGSGWGAMQLRLGGAVILMLIVWIILDAAGGSTRL